MKVSFIITLLLLVGLTGYAQKAKPEKSSTFLVEVSNVGGYPAFFLCDPVLSYKVVAKKGPGINWTSAVTGGLINPSIADKATKMVARLASECADKKIDFDAVIYSTGKEVSAIKFNQFDEAKAKLAKPKKIAGLWAFMFSAPYGKEFKSASESGGGIKWKSFLTGGLINNSIEEDFDKMARKIAEEAKEKGVNLDGVSYNTGKSVDGVIFE